MLKFINQELFGFNQVKKTSDKGDYYSTMVLTSENVTSRKDAERQYSPRSLLRITSPTEDYVQDVFHSISRRYRTEGDTSSFLVNLYANDKIRNDKVILFVAFPFNGMMIPMPEDNPGFILHRGMLVNSASASLEEGVNITNRDGYYQTMKFRNVVYLIFEVDESVFDSKSGDEYSITLTAYGRAQSNPDALAMSDKYELTITASSNGCFVDGHPVIHIDSAFNCTPSLPFFDTAKYRGKRLFTISEIKENPNNRNTGNAIVKSAPPKEADPESVPDRHERKERYSFKHEDAGKSRKGNGKKKKKNNRRDDRWN